MDFLLDILQGAGIAAAVGIRPFLPALLVGALAAGDLGVDFDGTDFAFLEERAVPARSCRAARGHRRCVRRAAATPAAPSAALRAAFAGSRSASGALLVAGSLADRGYDVVAGVVVGARLRRARLGRRARRCSRARARASTPAAAGALPLYAEAAALVAAGLSVLFPPLGVLASAVLVWLLLGGRRREGEKYAGLRILR